MLCGLSLGCLSVRFLAWFRALGRWLGGAQAPAGLGEVVLFELLGVGEQMVVIVVGASIVAVVGMVVAADLRPGLVELTEVVRPQVLTGRLNLQVPVAVLDENADAFVQEIPANIVVIPLGGGLVDLDGQIAAAGGRTVLTQYRSHASPFPDGYG